MRKGRQGKRTPQEVVTKALELARGGKVRGKALMRELEQLFPGEVPGDRTVRGWLAEARQVGSQPWTMADAAAPDPIVGEEDLSALLGVIHEAGAVTREEAPWVARLRRIAPHRPAWVVLAYARMYARRVARGAATGDLDREVARWVGSPAASYSVPVTPDTISIIGRRRPRKEQTDG